jgi:hypothetical protein
MGSSGKTFWSIALLTHHKQRKKARRCKERQIVHEEQTVTDELSRRGADQKPCQGHAY